MSFTITEIAVCVGCLLFVFIALKLYHLETTALTIKGHRLVFLDIGGHIGQTTRQVIKSNLFDQIYTFEPVPDLVTKIEKIADHMKDHRAQVQVMPVALGMGDGESTLYMPGTHSGTIYDNRWDKEPDAMTVQRVDAGRWFRENLKDDDIVFVKINCEGGEVGIIDSLEAASQLSRIRSVMIDFDVKRLFGRDDERLRLIGILEKNNVPFIDPRYIEKWGMGTGYLSVLRAITYLRIVREMIKKIQPSA